MRTLLALLALVAIGCGAESPSGPITTADAGDAGDGGADASGRRCSSLFEVFLGGRCVPATDSSCGGVACSSGLHCYTDFASDGGDDTAVCQ